MWLLLFLSVFAGLDFSRANSSKSPNEDVAKSMRDTALALRQSGKVKGQVVSILALTEGQIGGRSHLAEYFSGPLGYSFERWIYDRLRDVEEDEGLLFANVENIEIPCPSDGEDPLGTERAGSCEVRIRKDGSIGLYTQETIKRNALARYDPFKRYQTPEVIKAEGSFTTMIKSEQNKIPINFSALKYWSGVTDLANYVNYRESNDEGILSLKASLAKGESVFLNSGGEYKLMDDRAKFEGSLWSCEGSKRCVRVIAISNIDRGKSSHRVAASILTGTKVSSFEAGVERQNGRDEGSDIFISMGRLLLTERGSYRIKGKADSLGGFLASVKKVEGGTYRPKGVVSSSENKEGRRLTSAGLELPVNRAFGNSGDDLTFGVSGVYTENPEEKDETRVQMNLIWRPGG